VDDTGRSPWVDVDREGWAALRAATPLTLTADDLDGLRGIHEALDLDEVADVYLPLSRLLNLDVAATRARQAAVDAFLDRRQARVPYLVGVAGSVAVGKSTASRVLQALLARWPDHPRVEVVGTDGFLHPNAVLAGRGLMSRKGFPESYDVGRLVGFLADLKAGSAEVRAPVYSHEIYDVVPGEERVVAGADVVIVEGVNILQAETSEEGRRVLPSDFLDFSIYVHADEHDVVEWYVQRFLRLHATAFHDARSPFHRLAAAPPAEAEAVARRLWAEVNRPNLVEHILPSRDRADLVLTKGADHRVASVRLRRA
jgi:type I pantothenate kinase